jgi:hypothetical protein
MASRIRATESSQTEMSVDSSCVWFKRKVVRSPVMVVLLSNTTPPLRSLLSIQPSSTEQVVVLHPAFGS